MATDNAADVVVFICHCSLCRLGETLQPIPLPLQAADSPSPSRYNSAHYLYRSGEAETVSLAEFETQLLALPEADRIHLVDVLWESLVSGDVKERTQEWAREAEGRLSAVESGQLPLVVSEQVFQELRAKLGR